MDPKFKRWLTMIGAGAAGLVSVFAVLGYWDQYNLPRPAAVSEVRAAEERLQGQIAQATEQTTKTQSMLLNDLILRTQKQLYENEREQQKYISSGQDVPSWLIDEKLRLDRDYLSYQTELGNLLGQ